MKIRHILVVIIFSVAAAWGTIEYLEVKPFTGAAPLPPVQKETAGERVLRTGAIRCAYANNAPTTIVDPNTKAMTGVYHDIIDDMGRRLGLKVLWVEEVSYGNIHEGFVTDRYDLFCSALWPTSARARSGLFSAPLYYSPVSVFVRANDDRFNNDVGILNDPSFTVSITDGDVTQTIADQDFPLAKHLSADTPQSMEDVASSKSDATINDLINANVFMASNPNALKNASPGKPVRVFPNVILMPFGEHDLKALLDSAINEMQADGTIERILKKYLADSASYYVASKPYEKPAETVATPSSVTPLEPAKTIDPVKPPELVPAPDSKQPEPIKPAEGAMKP